MAACYIIPYMQISFTNSEFSDTKWLIFRNHAIARLKNVDLNNKNELIYRYNGYAARWRMDDSSG